MTITRDFPVQPEIVREWFRASRSAERSAEAILLGGLLPGATVAETADAALAALTSAFSIPAEVRTAYNAWAAEYNAAVARHNAEVQAGRNAQEITKIRKAACPSCYATHPGEC